MTATVKKKNNNVGTGVHFTTSSKLNGLILRHLQNSAKIVIKNKWLSTLQAPLQDSHKCVYAHCLIFKVFSQFGFGETNDSK